MTKDEAIEIFEGVGELEGTSIFYQPGGKASKLTIHGIKEASKMAISALRAQQNPVKLGGNQWEGCVVCDRCGEGGLIELRCGGVKAKYCPFCGRPLTGEARAELERRINGGAVD